MPQEAAILKKEQGEAMGRKNDGMKIVAENRKARHDYFIHETFETGLVLQGTEVKSLRAGRVNLKDSFASIKNGEIFVENMHISPYEQGNIFNHEPLRKRKLLMHKAEIVKLFSKTREKGFTLVPLKLYFSKGRAKLELALASGKHNYDKRRDLAEKAAKRDIERALKDHGKGLCMEETKEMAHALSFCYNLFDRGRRSLHQGATPLCLLKRKMPYGNTICKNGCESH